VSVGVSVRMIRVRKEVGVSVGVRVRVAVRVRVGVRVSVGVSVPVSVRVGRLVMVGVSVIVGVRVAVSVLPPGVIVSVIVAVTVARGVGVGVIVGEAPPSPVIVGVAVWVALPDAAGVLVGVDDGLGVGALASKSARATTSPALITPSPFTSRPGHPLLTPNRAASSASKSAWFTTPSQLVSPNNCAPPTTLAAVRSVATSSKQTACRRPAGILAGRPGLRSLGMEPFRHRTA
jgi:hypothetical protein